MLTDKQKRFCQEYVIDLNATQAAIRAGYSEKTAGSIGDENLKKPEIQNFISDLQSGIGKRLELTADMVVQELRALGFYNIQDLILTNGNLENLKELSRDLTKPIVGLKTTERWIPMGDETIHEVKTEVRLADKRAALVDIGKHLGIFERDNKQKAEGAIHIPAKITLSNGTVIDLE